MGRRGNEARGGLGMRLGMRPGKTWEETRGGLGMRPGEAWE